LLSQALEDLGRPHIRSFDWAMDEGLKKVIQGVPAISFETPQKERITLRVTVGRSKKIFMPSGQMTN